MASETSRPSQNPLRQLTVPVGVVVAVVVVAAWYVTWASSDFLMMMTAPMMIGSTDLALFFALIVVMMVAMMLPSAVPMIVAYHGLTRLEGGRPVKPADGVATAAFILPYFVVWGAFGVAALLGLMTLGFLGPWTGVAVLIPAATLLAAGAPVEEALLVANAAGGLTCTRRGAVDALPTRAEVEALLEQAKRRPRTPW